MATFLTAQQELADRLTLDLSITANATRIKRWLNLALNIVYSRAQFDFLEARGYIQTVTDKTDGTVSITATQNTVTGVGTAFASTDKRSFIQFQGDTNWYEITTFSSTTSISIFPAAIATYSGVTYKIRKVYYDLSTEVVELLDMRQTSTPAKLTRLGTWSIDYYQPDIQLTGPPVAYNLFRTNVDTTAVTDKNYQVAFFPIPDALYNIDYKYTKYVADLSANGDLPLLPVLFHDVWIDGAEWLGSKFVNDGREALLKQEFENGVQRMLARKNSFGDLLPTLQPSDRASSTRFIQFPGTFEQPR